MKAIILAAGQGTRLRPLTDDIPKCMVKLWDRPLLEWQVEALSAAGVSEIIVVTGYRAEKITLPKVRTCHNPNFAETNMVGTLFCAEDELNSDVIISYADIIYSADIVKNLIDVTVNANKPVNVVVDLHWQKLWELRMEDPLQDAETLKFDRQGNISEIGKKPTALSEIEAQYIGLISIKAEAWPKIRELYHQLAKDKLYDGKDFQNMYMTSFLTQIKDHGFPLSPVKIEGGWCEVDSLKDLETYQALEKDSLIVSNS